MPTRTRGYSSELRAVTLGDLDPVIITGRDGKDFPRLAKHA